jgi:plastocyanin
MKSGSHILAVLTLALFAVTMAPSRNASAADNSASSIAIKIDNFSFAPQTITIPAGTQVTWTNEDDIPHTVVSEDKTTFKSHALDTDEKFSFTFTKPGTYTYFCSIHPKMTAKIIVQ